MEKLKKYMLILLLPILLGAMITSCDKAEDEGEPKVSFVRLTNPEIADSVIVSSFMGSTIAIIGENLGGAVEIWFNDLKANLNPNFITKNSILVTIPNKVAGAKTDIMKIVFRNGKIIDYPFEVSIDAPVIESIICEFVPTGGIAEIHGLNFFNPKVFFPDNVEATISEADPDGNWVKVIVPEGAGSGKIIIKSLFGEGESPFNFRDENVFLDFEDDGIKKHENWTAKHVLASTNPLPAGCDGDYVAFQMDDIGAWGWKNELLMAYWSIRNPRGSVPFVTGDPNELVLKFEINVVNPWTSIPMEITFGAPGETNTRDTKPACVYKWEPWKETGSFSTNGWITVSVPLTSFKDFTTGAAVANWSPYCDMTFMLFGAATENQNFFICLDNIRITNN
jgi:hypothetical protein